MAESNFDMGAFYAAIDSQRQAMGITWKDVALESGVSASTLTRMSQGKRPDVDGLAALLKWSGLQAETFIAKSASEKNKKPETISQITALLRADKSISKETALALEQILKAAYKRFK